ncbi:putative ferric-chelate reductase 1 isoform X2 [Hemiscyllium ocellatum]|uniref:putative ferric-chelate reductase 1 isoform X2 n=1 Tax=Hemiscyllium ocellatum TaxID=170820 RepID=UPI00296724C2|nr:putative ferric-chelate reductase 1 isoform X2 [Hemiscyllium ocellatum]
MKSGCGLLLLVFGAAASVRMRRHTWFLLFSIAATFPVYVLGYSNGEVESACASMRPSHGGNTAQSTDAPYQIIANSSRFNPGDIIQVTLRSNPGTIFKGFLLEARAAGSSSQTPLGTFTQSPEDAQLLDCPIDGTTYRSSAVSHRSASNKIEIIVNWIASDTGNIQFRATFVQSFSTFWMNVRSETIERSGSNVPPSTMTTPLNTITLSQGISSNGCGSTKFCFSNPAQCNPASDPNCFFMSSTPKGSQGLQFEMSGRSTGYISIGFSDDQLMGNDDIYICGMDVSGNIQVQRAYSTGRVRPRIEPLGEVDNMTVANENGIIQCTFVTRNNISTVQRAANNQYYLFFAYGPSARGRITLHSEIPFISTEKVDVTVVQLIGGNNNRSILIRTHAALMLIAWMTVGSIGMIIAKFLKCLGGQKKILGKNLWFQLHWTLMILTVVLTIIGFVLAFVQVKGWSANAGAHPVLGCIVMGLSLIQPTVAFCRPSPDHKRRFIFNTFHACMALVIKILAVATLFLGFKLIGGSENSWMVKVLGGFVGWGVLNYILFCICCCCKGKASYIKCQKKVEPNVILLIVYICGNLAFLIALLVGIGQI